MEGKIIYELNRMLINTSKFALKPISREIFENIIKAGLYAPYGLNPPQPWKFIGLISNRAVEISRKLDRISNCLILCFCPKVKDYFNQLTNYGSTFSAIYNFRLQAIAYGIVSEVLVDLNEEFKNFVYKEFRIDSEYELVAVVLFGYPAQKIEPRVINRDVLWRIE